MSACEVSGTHLDVMLAAGLARSGAGPLTWIVPGTDPPRSRELTRATVHETGGMLRAENLRNLGRLYGRPPETAYRYRRLPRFPDPVAALKAIDFYEYQSCDHDGWEGGEAAAFCAALRLRLIGQLPDYDDAPWGFEEPHRARFGDFPAA